MKIDERATVNSNSSLIINLIETYSKLLKINKTIKINVLLNK